MAKKPVQLSNGRAWETQGAALQHFKQMLSRYADEQTIDDRVDHDDLLALLVRYDETVTDQPSKIGVGVDYFFRRRNVFEGYSTSSFWVRRTDNSETDWSYLHAVRGQPRTAAAEFYDACRVAVDADLLAAKRRFFQEYGNAQGLAPCDITNLLMSIDEAHLDHAYPTFAQLVVTFRAARGWAHEIPAGILTAPQDMQTRTQFIDAALAANFREYHHAAAILRVIHRDQNLSMAARQRRPKVKRPVKIP
jgi:Protein of unknown function (DUF3223)